MSEKRNIVEELLKRNCLITPDSYEVLEDLDYDTIDLDQLAEILKDEIVVTAEILKEALDNYGKNFSEGFTEEEVDAILKRETAEKLSNAKINEKEAITEDLLEKINLNEEKIEAKTVPTKKTIKQKADFQPIGRKIKKKIRIYNDSSGKTTIEGTLEDFQQYFIHRFKQMQALLKSRGDISTSFRIKDLEKAKIDRNETIAIIAMVTEKTALRNGGILLEVEDLTGKIVVIISNKMQELVLKAGSLLLDQVAAFFGVMHEGRLILQDFTFPDVPILTNKSEIKHPINVCMTSDLHIGSKEFLEDSFNNLIAFLNGKVDDTYQQTIASQVKYLIIGGDVVEGIGVYPKQEEDLVITDIYEQYNYAAKLLEKVPKWIEIIIISGNHDACRQALPQPAISREYAPKLWEMDNVTMLSNPSIVELHGRVFLLYHGNSFEDVAALTPGLNMSEPNGPMIYTLRYRHLAPTYGRRSSLVPSHRDELIISKVPDVYHTGHIHINSHTRYRGVECINSGTFQSQTEYMLSKNIHPTPGRVPILNLQSNKLHELVFYAQDTDETKQ